MLYWKQYIFETKCSQFFHQQSKIVSTCWSYSADLQLIFFYDSKNNDEIFDYESKWNIDLLVLVSCVKNCL